MWYRDDPVIRFGQRPLRLHPAVATAAILKRGYGLFIFPLDGKRHYPSAANARGLPGSSCVAFSGHFVPPTIVPTEVHTLARTGLRCPGASFMIRLHILGFSEFVVSLLACAALMSEGFLALGARSGLPGLPTVSFADDCR